MCHLALGSPSATSQGAPPPHDDVALEARLPAEVQGVRLVTISFTYDQFAAVGGHTQVVQKVAAALGIAPSSVSIAVAAPEGDAIVRAIVVSQFPGADPATLTQAIGDLANRPTTVADRTIYDAGAGGQVGVHVYVLIAGDAMYLITSTDVDRLTAAVQKLPE